MRGGLPQGRASLAWAYTSRLWAEVVVHCMPLRAHRSVLVEILRLCTAWSVVLPRLPWQGACSVVELLRAAAATRYWKLG